MSDFIPPAHTCPQCGIPVIEEALEGLCPGCVATLYPCATTAITGNAAIGTDEAGILIYPRGLKPGSLPNSEFQGLLRTSTAIRFLKWIELIELKSAYSRFRKQESTDAWIFAENGEAVGPVSFDDILVKLREGQSPLAIIHESKAHDEEPNWSELVYNPVWSRPFVALVWSIGFWFAAIIVGFVSLQPLLPAGMIRTLGSIVYCLLVLSAAYTLSKPHLKNWSTRIRKYRTRT